jgi:hypothetical protein
VFIRLIRENGELINAHYVLGHIMCVNWARPDLWGRCRSDPIPYPDSPRYCQLHGYNVMMKKYLLAVRKPALRKIFARLTFVLLMASCAVRATSFEVPPDAQGWRREGFYTFTQVNKLQPDKAATAPRFLKRTACQGFMEDSQYYEIATDWFDSIVCGCSGCAVVGTWICCGSRNGR